MPILEEEVQHTPIRQVFSASGSDLDEEVFADDQDSTLTDSYSESSTDELDEELNDEDE
jgi:hypothetical protein